MPISNLEYLYEHLPARMRRDDDELFLKRYLSEFGEELDGFDLQLNSFFEKIAPETAPIEFIDWWLYAFFGWGWFPSWFTDTQRRVFYAAIAQHYARRGTLGGIQEFLLAFGIRSIVEGEPRFWGEETWGENVWSVTGPLIIIVRLFPEAPAVSEDLIFYGEATWGDDFGASPAASIQRADVEALLRFCWPLAQHIFIEDLPFEPTPSGLPVGAGYGDAEYGSAIPG